MYTTKDEEYNYYRELYISDMHRNRFPFEAAYYYYSQNINRIDMLTFEDFKDSLLSVSHACGGHMESFQTVSKPIYTVLDTYYNVTELLSQDNKLIMLV